MIPQAFEYNSPKSLDEALGLLAQGAKPLAGGMSLIPMMKLRLAAPERVVDLCRLKDLNYIREEGGPGNKATIHIGATTSHQDIASSPLLRGKCPLMPETASHIGDPQVRNMGTIGGSSAHADPSADYPAALQALEARFVLRSSRGERTIAASDFFLDTFTTALEPGEIVREVIVPVDDEGTGVRYEKLVQPASGFAIVGIAVRVRKSGGTISMVRIGVTGLGNIGYRANASEKSLEGKGGSAADVQAAAALIADGVAGNADLQASADYRRHLAAVYANRAITAALGRTA